MNLGAILTCKTICQCAFCGWKGKPWEQAYVFVWDGKIPKGRTVKNVCPKCRTLDSIECNEPKE